MDESIENIISNLNEIKKVLRDERIIEKLDNLMEMWENVKKCINGDCRVEIDERYKKAYGKFPGVHISISIDENIAMKEICNKMREYIINTKEVFVERTGSVLQDIIGKIRMDMLKLETLLERLNGILEKSIEQSEMESEEENDKSGVKEIIDELRKLIKKYGGQ